MCYITDNSSWEPDLYLHLYTLHKDSVNIPYRHGMYPLGLRNLGLTNLPNQGIERFCSDAEGRFSGHVDAPTAKLY